MKTLALKQYFTFLLFLVSFAAFGQAGWVEEIVYLKNGSVIRGIIVEEIPGKSYKIQTADNSIIVFNYEDIEKITREIVAHPKPTKQSSTASGSDKPSKANLYLGLSFYSGLNSDYNSKSSGVEAILDYHTTPYITTGLGVGLDGYDGLSWIPLFAEIKVDLAPGKTQPFIFGRCGYYAPVQSYDNWRDYTGGLMLAAGAGIKTALGEKSSLIFKVGYRYLALNYAEMMYAQPLSGIEQGTGGEIIQGGYPYNDMYPYYYYPEYSINSHLHFVSLSVGIAF